MKESCQRSAAQNFPVIDFLCEEMVARKWSLIDLLDRMPGERDVNALALDLLTLRDKSILLGREMASKLEAALGVSAQLWLNLDSSWRG